MGRDRTAILRLLLLALGLLALASCEMPVPRQEPGVLKRYCAAVQADRGSERQPTDGTDDAEGK